ncbi:YfbU family protein [Serratia liquefaciens]|uniref:YfbU family protein n=1 Tax=Serratia liquefaciens TaxID=614 RepID=UPI0021C86558|nr:YfbU family protein [Serratia liquefaciens]
MKLTKKDRLLLINQYKILERISPEDSEHYSELISILENGYSIFYSMVDDWISEDMTESECNLVLQILSIYRMIEDRKRVDKDEALLNHTHSYFRGFDGNNETSLMSFARFLIFDQNKFSEQLDYLSKNDRLNSHTPMKNKYQRMIDKWNGMSDKWDVSTNDLVEILNS